MSSLLPGTRIGDFVVDGLLGRGGMGEVYRATQMRLGSPVALKVLAPAVGDQAGFVQRFVREATIMRDLEHPAIVTVYDAGEDGGRLYLAMRLMESMTLRDVLDQRQLPVTETLRLLGPLADALDYAHSRGVVHRDIKPANVLLDGAGRPYLADFGIAKALEHAPVTLGASTLGTPLYMAPEQAAGDVSHRSDLYAFGCVAFEMLTGSPPYPPQEPLPLLFAHAQAAVPAATERNPRLPPGIDAVFRRALAKQPADRYGSAAEFVAAQRMALASTSRPGFPPAPLAPSPPAPGRAWLWWVAAAAAVVMVVVAGIVFQLTRPGPVTTAGSGTPAGPSAAAPTGAAPPTFPAAGPRQLPDPPVAHGALIFGPALDGSGTGFRDSPGAKLDPSAGAIRHVSGALELEALAPESFVYVELDAAPGVTTYVADLEVAVRPGSEVRQCWSLRWAVPGQLAWYWCLDTATEQAGFWRFANGSLVPISPAVAVADLQTGRTVQVTLEVRQAQLRMHLDGRPVADVADDTVAMAATLPGLELSGTPGTGLVRIEGLRYWDLPAP